MAKSNPAAMPKPGEMCLKPYFAPESQEIQAANPGGRVKRTAGMYLDLIGYTVSKSKRDSDTVKS